MHTHLQLLLLGFLQRKKKQHIRWIHHAFFTINHYLYMFGEALKQDEALHDHLLQFSDCTQGKYRFKKQHFNTHFFREHKKADQADQADQADH